jgi:hypothetical protein
LFDDRAQGLDAAAWEELCRLAVPRLEGVLGHSFGRAQRYWRGSAPEFDVVAAAHDGALLLGEVKWSTAAASADMLVRAHRQLLAKGTPRAGDPRPIHALFVPRLPRRRPKSLPTDLHLIDAAAVLAAFED